MSKDATGISSINVGTFDPIGKWTLLDSAALPEGSTMRLAAIGDYMHDPRYNPSEYGALLYSGPYTLPGLLFTSTGKAGSAKLAPLAVVAASISVEY